MNEMKLMTGSSALLMSYRSTENTSNPVKVINAAIVLIIT